MVVVVGQREVAREINFDSVAFSDGHRGHDVEELVEDLRRRLRSALSESLAHNVGTRSSERTRRSTLRNGSECADGYGDSVNTEIVIVHLIAKASIAGLVKSFELVKAQGITIRHDEAVEENGQTRLAECVHFLSFA